MLCFGFSLARGRFDATGEYYPSHWFHIVPSKGINTTFNFSGLPMDRRYETAFLGNTTIEWIREAVQHAPPQPFFAFIAPHAPHGASIPAPWYNASFGALTAPRPPSYGHWGRDHHWLVAQQTEAVTPVEEAEADSKYRLRWQCLLSVDDLVVGVRSALDELKAIDNTYFFYTSDHGFHFHELRLGVGKWNVYDVDIRTHMFISGPGITPGSTLRSVAQHVDLAPTWLGLAGIATPERASCTCARAQAQPRTPACTKFCRQFQSLPSFAILTVLVTTCCSLALSLDVPAQVRWTAVRSCPSSSPTQTTRTSRHLSAITCRAPWRSGTSHGGNVTAWPT